MREFGMAGSKLSQHERSTFYFRGWRKFRGVTQQELAQQVGLSAPSISQLELGKQGFSDRTLIAIADALDCHPGDLLMREPETDLPPLPKINDEEAARVKPVSAETLTIEKAKQLLAKAFGLKPSAIEITIRG